jgi:ribosome maturation factor RimP
VVNPELEQLVAACVEKHGAHVIDMGVHGRRGRTAVDVFIDSPQDVTTGLCSAVSREISAALRAHPVVDPDAHLTVSSPGIDRPLKFQWQYVKHVGRDLRVTCGEGEERTEIIGRLVAVGGESLTLEPPGTAKPVVIPLSSVRKAIVKAPW